MKGSSFLPAFIAVSVGMFACTHSAPFGRTAPDILSSRDSIRNAVLRGDARSTAAFFSPSAVITPPDADEISGRDAIRDLFTGVFQQVRITQYEIRPDTIFFARDRTAIERGTYVEKVVPNQGPPTVLNGRYIFFWERGADGVWRATRLLYNHGPAKK